jgi:hypothetical protein
MSSNNVEPITRFLSKKGHSWIYYRKDYPFLADNKRNKSGSMPNKKILATGLDDIGPNIMFLI